MTGAEGTTAAAPVTTLVDLIDGLAEPPEPAAVPLVPQTWGWAVLAALALTALAWALWRRRARWRADAYRRAALSELAQADTGAEVARLMRRAALAAWPRAQVAGLTGCDWIAFLDRTGPAPFPPDAAAELRTAPYRAEATPASANLRAAAAAWLRHHRPDAAPPTTPSAGRGAEALA